MQNDQSSSFLVSKKYGHQSNRINTESLVDYLYNAKAKVIPNNNISTLRDKNFTWSTLQKDPPSINTNKGNEKNITASDPRDWDKINDWLDSNGLQSERSTSITPIESNYLSQNKFNIVQSQRLNHSSPSSASTFIQQQSRPPYAEINGSRLYYPHNITSKLFSKQIGSVTTINPFSQYPRIPYQSLASPKKLPPKDWSCLITSGNNCSIQNDPQTGELFRHQSFNYKELSGSNSTSSLPESIPTQWYLTLNTSIFPANKIGARLITPYIPINRAHRGCLTLEFITTGDEIDRIVIFQQDTDNRCLWSGIPDSNFRMNLIELTLQFHRSDPRFFIEIYLKPLKTKRSSFSLSRINLSFEQSCQINQSNSCAPRPIPPYRTEKIIP
ncbi:metal transporter CNNM2-like [Sarcoptes scabiei]|nr:metal transporter CNNM2-like [Sarcoptes scabiei]